VTASRNLRDLSDVGVSIWLDDLSRQRITSGNLRELIENHELVGVTSNPTIFDNAVSSSRDYEQQLRALAARGTSPDEAALEITTTDVRDACDVFRGVYENTGKRDGRVSLEVDPRLAHDTDATIAQVQELWKTVNRPNLMVKIPATQEGLPAITRSLAEGISVNVTLIFSIERYRAVLEAFLSGLEQAYANGHALGEIASVGSFFVSRVDTEIDKRLERLGSPGELWGRAAVANARLAYAAYERMLSGQRWDALEQVGARRQRPLWASIGVKNPSYSDTMYVEELAAPNTVQTMPEATLFAAADHARIRGDQIRGTEQESLDLFDALREQGIDLDDVYAVLEREGVDKFAKSWKGLLSTIQQRLEQESR
jgi:transaldolase